MIIRNIALAATAAILVSGTALAQASWVEVDDSVMVAAFNANADTVDDWDVHAPDGTKIGEVEEVLGTDAQTPAALAVDFEGNGGFADRDVAIPLDQFTWDGTRLVLNAEASAVSQMPVWDD